MKTHRAWDDSVDTAFPTTRGKYQVKHCHLNPSHNESDYTSLIRATDSYQDTQKNTGGKRA